jgi:hypothetical protein
MMRAYAHEYFLCYVFSRAVRRCDHSAVAFGVWIVKAKQRGETR